MAEYDPERTSFDVDESGFLIDTTQWNRHFAEQKAVEAGIAQGLTKEHWDVMNYIRNMYRIAGRCPLVYETCRHCGLRRQDLKRLFPSGYLRGACKLAGLTYREGYLSQSYLPKTAEDLNHISFQKTYKVDVRGFLIDPDEWDEYFAAFRAHDMKIPGGRLSDDHWRIIKYVRQQHAQTGEVPTVYRTCEDNQIELDQLEQLFPDGYHRGLVKIAGLRVR
jgi:tRNA 2-thiouridine synthesizing protein E